jgi:hypothetical protein
MRIIISILFILVFSSCQKNQDFVEITKTPIELFIRLNLEEDQIQENAYGAICTSENQEVVVISNKQELLSSEIDFNALESGDFILVRQIQGEFQSFLCVYVWEYISDGTPVVGLFVDESSELDSFSIDGSLVTGSHLGSFTNDEGVEFPYTLSFSCGLTTNPDLCN